MKKEKKIASISTFLGSDAKIEGAIEFEGTIRLDGRVEGKVFSKGGTLIVGEKAVVHADIIVGAAIIMGEVSGTIEARNRIEVHPPGRISGDIQTPVISVETGGILNGSCAMKSQSVPQKKSAVSPQIPSASVLTKGQ